MLVIDGIELAALNHLPDVRHFEHCNASFFQEPRDPTDYSIQIRHMGQNVIGMNDIGAYSFRAQLFGEFRSEEIARASARRAPQPRGRCSSAGSMPSTGMPARW